MSLPTNTQAQDNLLRRTGSINSALLWQLQSNHWLYFELLCSYFRDNQYAEICITNPFTAALGIKWTATKFKSTFVIILISRDEIQPSTLRMGPRKACCKLQRSREGMAQVVKQHTLSVSLCALHKGWEGSASMYMAKRFLIRTMDRPWKSCFLSRFLAKCSISAKYKVVTVQKAKAKELLILQMWFQSLAPHLRIVQKCFGCTNTTIPKTLHVAEPILTLSAADTMVQSPRSSGRNTASKGQDLFAQVQCDNSDCKFKLTSLSQSTLHRLSDQVPIALGSLHHTLLPHNDVPPSCQLSPSCAPSDGYDLYK